MADYQHEYRGILRRARKERRISTKEDEVALLAEIGNEQWERSLEAAHELMLPEAALKRLTWEQ
jgi:hypothetical protein